MGFAFYLAIVLGVPALFFVSLLVLIYNIGKNKRIVRVILMSWGIVVCCIFSLIVFATIIKFFTEKKQLKRSDIYGSYVVDRSIFPGKQADWQYNHYRFEITKQDSFRFFITDQNKATKIIKGKIEFLDGYEYRLRIKTNTLTPQIIDPEPTLYRRVFSFYYVFNSPLYHNMFFTKGEWKPIAPTTDD